MPREAIIFGDLIGKLDMLRVECAKCGRSGRYRLADLLMRYGRAARSVLICRRCCDRRDYAGRQFVTKLGHRQRPNTSSTPTLPPGGGTLLLLNWLLREPAVTCATMLGDFSRHDRSGRSPLLGPSLELARYLSANCPGRTPQRHCRGRSCVLGRGVGQSSEPERDGAARAGPVTDDSGPDRRGSARRVASGLRVSSAIRIALERARCRD